MRLHLDHMRAVIALLLTSSFCAAGAGTAPATPIPRDGADFRAARWGMSRTEIRRQEPARPDLNDGPLIAFPDTVAGQACRIVYIFREDQLCMGFYQFSNTHPELDAYFDDATSYREQIATIYSEPQIEKWDWADPMFADEPDLKTEALGLGLVDYELGWMTDRSIVALRMSGGNREADIVVMYADRRCFPNGQKVFGDFFANRVGLPSPYFRQNPDHRVNP